MDLTLTQDQELIRSTARELLRSRAAAAGVRAAGAGELGYSTELWKEMVGLGWNGLAVPEGYGGVGEGFLEVCLLIEEMGAAQVPSPFRSTVGCAAPPITRFGTEQQRAEWLAAIAAGRVISYVRAAPKDGWDSLGSEVIATPADGGYTLEGIARFVPFGHVAEDLLVVSQLAGADPERLGVFLVDAAAPGITRAPLRVIGVEPSHQVGFEAVRVPVERALGEVGAGREVVAALDAFGAAATCAEMVGGAQRVLDLTVRYATGRTQFGRPIGSFQAVQHHCADMAIDVLGSRFIAYEAIWRLSAGQAAEAEVAMAKAWVSEAYQRVCTLGQQVHGAIGFTEEHDLHLFLRHATSAALTFGDSDFHTDRLATHLGLASGDDPTG